MKINWWMVLFMMLEIAAFCACVFGYALCAAGYGWGWGVMSVAGAMGMIIVYASDLWWR